MVQAASPPMPAASTRGASQRAGRQQPQYTQTVILNFLGVNWPHISVATLTKQ